MGSSGSDEEPRYTAVNKNIPLPSNINTDKQAILDILHNHFLLAQIFWPDHDVIAANSMSGTTVFTLRNKILRYITHRCGLARMVNFSNSVSVAEKLVGLPETIMIYFVTKTEGQSRYTLEERFMKDIPADGAFVNCVFYDGHQRHTIALLEFLNKNTSSDKRPPNPIKLKKD